MVSCCLGPGMSTATALQSNSPSSAKSIDASNSSSVMASTLAQSVRSSPRRSISSSSAALYRTIRSFFPISCSPDRDDPDCITPLRPNDGHQSIFEYADAQKSRFIRIVSRHLQCWSAVEQLTRLPEVDVVLLDVAPALCFI